MGFDFQSATTRRNGAGDGLLVGDALVLAGGYTPSPPQIQLDSTTSELASIGSRKVTDALLIAPVEIPFHLDLNPAWIEARAGWISVAYLFREAAWRF